MKIIEVKALSNNAHRNQVGEFDTIPKGWAAIPEDVETPNFPFGEIQTRKIDGILTVTKWMPRDIHEQPPITEHIGIDERLSVLESAMLDLILGGDK